MASALKLFILAGEPSGDRIAADLVVRLRQRVSLSLVGVGGDELKAMGLAPLYPMSDLAVMGVSDVLRRLPLLLWRVEQTARAIRAGQPDIVVLVDAQDFSKLVAKRLKALGYPGTVILYVAPTVWARAPKRAAKLKPLFDEVLAVLPFEPEIMQKLGGPPTCYVGHPALAEGLNHVGGPEVGPLIVLPGSREGELRRHLLLFRAAIAGLADHPAIDGVVIPTLPALAQRIGEAVADWPLLVSVNDVRADRSALYGRAVAAISVAGTATLELAMARVPMVVSYVMDNHQARVFDKLGRPRVSLPNIILDRPVVTELAQSRPDAAAITASLRTLLDNKKVRQDQIAAFGELGDLMDSGAAGYPRQDPADRILSYWSRS
ncbi:MAG: lipid-A-disaccharide synthase [Candidatus Devosia symbiotica]|nr:lipid-A-disaccharide synthase [Candidatus Devosia symbiotica]